MSHDIEQHTPPPSPTRRTVLTGAAWSVPVIAAASLAPLAAASGTPVLAFNQATYNGTACGTITGASVSVTTNGTPTAGVSVTTTLSGGYTFAGGSATYTGVSDGSGAVALPAITVPGVGGTVSLSASSGATTTSSTVASAIPQNGAYVKYAAQTSSDHAPHVPTNARPLAAGYFLATNGDLYKFDTLVDTNVIDATGYNYGGTGDAVVYTKADGGYLKYAAQTTSTKFSDVPSSAKPLAGIYFLAPNGDLFKANTVVDTNVKAATGYNYGGTGDAVVYTKTNGGYIKYQFQSTSDFFPDVPSTAKPLAGIYFLALNGDLYKGNSIVDTNVTAATGYNYGGTGDAVVYTKPSGAYIKYQAQPSSYFSSNVPANTEPLAAGYFLGPDGKLYKNNSVVDTNVTSATGYNYGGTGDTVVYTKAAPC
ncbi:hypothetical protein [Microbacterium sp. Bi128]|uniref:hypothetical protein n=1 Tax=Microbacterium sp. Bi128 TaxID=2821115 RepID=UPI001E5FC6AA|nr:hypothetical protein [Microbacterium sp. Bi128]